MNGFRRQASLIARRPWAFLLQVLKSFRANQGLLLAGAIAYYTLLSIVPLLILIFITLSHFVDPKILLSTLARYLELVVPGQSRSLLAELDNFVAHRDVIGGVLTVTLLFFSSLAFTVLENAMSVIFFHRVAIRRRHFLVSALIPYCYILVLGVGLLVVTLVANALQNLGEETLDLLGWSFSLRGFSGALLYLVGVSGEILVVTSIYMVMPVGRLSLQHALAGGVTAALLWEATRHILAWYLSTLSQVSLVYGSLTSSIVVLLSVEIAATVLLLGAQVIAEYERIGREPVESPAQPLHTGSGHKR